MILQNRYEWLEKKFVWSFKAIKSSPIIITVPHDRGFVPRDLLGFFEARTKGVVGNDNNVWPIVKDILLSTDVNAVRGLVPRHFIDYNRSLEGINYSLSEKEPQTALENNDWKIFYDYYHLIITKFINQVVKNYRKEDCLLMDFHGFSRQPPDGEYDLIFGTGNRKTMFSSIDKEMASFLLFRGYKVFLPKAEDVEDMYSADFTTRHYAEKFKINAIQVEIAKKFRTREGEDLGRKLANDFAEFFKLMV